MYRKIHHIITFHLRRIKLKIINQTVFQKFRLGVLLPLGLYDKAFLNIVLDSEWKSRIDDVVNCPDNDFIKRHAKAGIVKNGKQMMHNGILITLGGYYGEPMTQMLKINKGVHEPQEEFAFEKVLLNMSEGATMIELGAYWSFYSIWFNKMVKGAKNYLVEPELFNMMYGINNLRLNNAQGNFTRAYVGKTSSKGIFPPVICVDDYVSENNISFIDILHSDIQGYEYEMLLGAKKSIIQNKIGYMFISTHGNEVHYKCLNFLMENEFQILCHADEFDTYSLDGLIVAKAKNHRGVEKIDISLKSNVK